MPLINAIMHFMVNETIIESRYMSQMHKSALIQTKKCDTEEM